jgi:hypothetical protein
VEGKGADMLCTGPKRELQMIYLLTRYRYDDLNNWSNGSSENVN